MLMRESGYTFISALDGVSNLTNRFIVTVFSLSVLYHGFVHLPMLPIIPNYVIVGYFSKFELFNYLIVLLFAIQDSQYPF